MQVSASAGRYIIEIECHSSSSPTWMLGPHKDLGFVPYCRDSFEGKMRIRIWRQNGLLSVIWNTIRSLFTGPTLDSTSATHDTETHGTQTKNRGKLIVDATSDAPALECGGGQWDDTWSVDSSPSKLLISMIARPIDLD